MRIRLFLVLLCIAGSRGTQGQVIINEFLADPPYGMAGDANGDGFRDPDADDFVEILNNGSSSVNLSGYRIRDGFAIRHIIPSGTVLSPGQALVVFGGGQPRGWFGGALVQTASTGLLSLSRAGDEIHLETPAGVVVQSIIYGSEGGQRVSITRNPDGSAALPGTPHDLPSTASSRLFSPGTRLNGVPFGAPSTTLVRFFLPQDQVWEDSGTFNLQVQLAQPSGSASTSFKVKLHTGASTDLGGFTETSFSYAAAEQGVKSLSIPITNNTSAEGIRRLVFRIEDVSGGNAASATLDSMVLFIQDDDLLTPLRINEVLADPPDGIEGDANRDGIRSAGDDSFIELVNASGSSLDISGYRLYDRSQLRHVFPGGSILASGAALVVFGGGSPTGSFGEAIVQTASTGTLSLTNKGDTLILETANGSEVIRWMYDDRAHQNQSITRWPDVTGTATPMILHSEAPVAAPTLFSPGTKVDGSSFSEWLGSSSPHVPADHGMSIYPQPATDQLYVRLSDAYSLPVQIQWLDLQGRVCGTQQLGDSLVRLSLEHLQPGVYWLVVTDNHLSRSIPFSVVNNR